MKMFRRNESSNYSLNHHYALGVPAYSNNRLDYYIVLLSFVVDRRYFYFGIKCITIVEFEYKTEFKLLNFGEKDE